MKRAGALAFGFALLASFTSLAFPAQAYEIQELDDKSIIGDFVIGPAKAEVVVEPGTQKDAQHYRYQSHGR